MSFDKDSEWCSFAFIAEHEDTYNEIFKKLSEAIEEFKQFNLEGEVISDKILAVNFERTQIFKTLLKFSDQVLTVDMRKIVDDKEYWVTNNLEIVEIENKVPRLISKVDI